MYFLLLLDTRFLRNLFFSCKTTFSIKCNYLVYRCTLWNLCLADVRLPKISVDPKTGHFLDPAGRIRIFHGLNSVEKQEPWYEINFREGDLMEAMRDMGLNIIRLGNMWTGWQPEDGDSINNTYVDILEVN